MQKLNLTPWQLVFVKILVDENPRTVYANNLRFQDIVFETYKTGNKYAKEVGNTKLARTYAKLNNEMRDIVLLLGFILVAIVLTRVNTNMNTSNVNQNHNPYDEL